MERAASGAKTAWVTVGPGQALTGNLRVPGSKSLAQRYLMGAFLAPGITQIGGLPASEDVQSLLGALRSVAGAEWGRGGSFPGWNLPGSAQDDPELDLDIGESGTGARFLTACLALGGASGRPFQVRPRGSLTPRSSGALVQALRDAGAHPTGPDGMPGTWPLRCLPIDCPEQLALSDPKSSQEVSALLFALAKRGGGVLTVRGPIPSLPYIHLTQSALATFGVRVVDSGGAFEVVGELQAPSDAIQIEPDASAAAVALAAGCVSGGRVRVPGLDADSAQGDLRVLTYLRQLGCQADVDSRGLTASGLPRRGATLDLRGEPDLAPVLAVVAALACLHSGEPSRLTGLGTLEGKESPRLTGLAQGLASLGWGVRRGLDWLAIDSPPGSRPGSGQVSTVDPCADHRMAFAFGLLGVGFRSLRIRDPYCASKSWPSFWDDLSQLGATVELGEP